MKNLFVLASLAFLLASCGGMTKEEKDEMNNFDDSIKSDTSINSSVDAANDFLNNDSVGVDSIAVAPVE
ncbi:MAG: hypothetical protein C0592_11515 [Marinilabiliales bacterium]|nr:MAG: hypothetical protein C0592_11515 [Marinilabiliales bacterium]